MAAISAYAGTAVVAALLAALVICVVVKLIRDRKKGKSSCGCGCANCPSAGLCHGQKQGKAVPERPKD